MDTRNIATHWPLRVATLVVLAIWACVPAPAQDSGLSTDILDSIPSLPGGLAALPAKPPVPKNNPQSPAKIELGKMLFFDTRLSRDGSLSCASCHDPAKAFSDGLARAQGLGHKTLGRHSPTVLNAAFNPSQFWDGRASTLEEQASMPMLSAAEMGMSGANDIVNRLRQIPGYRKQFRTVFGGDVTLDRTTQAIAAFERTLITPDSAFDRYVNGDKHALTEPEKRGLIVFFGKGSCTQCHNGPNFTDGQFHSLGSMPGSTPGETSSADAGRFSVTKNPEDLGAFKTPSLRNIVLRAPYMHNGSITTLNDVIAFYDRGGGQGQKSDLIRPLLLTDIEKADLLVFLQALNGTYPVVKPPVLPPDVQSRGNR